MDSQKLQDKIYLALGKSACFTGATADAYRPTGPEGPLNKQNRYLRLPAVFTPADGKSDGYGQPLWHGVFDGSYTRPGDYLVCSSRIFFIASQEPLAPILCVRTNRTISIVRPNQQTMVATNPYGGYQGGDASQLLLEYPASVLGENRSSASNVDLPSDLTVPYWSVLLPAPSGLLLSPGDLITDDLNRSAVIASSELTSLGWRINAKMATT
jgi:hypothetical protein